ncbi:hypothetical protein ACFOUV_17375 [Oceanobacillus longus]|uniref:GIY-YIG domain-containing protein n=1 Tax=Oceanobacillus longus TaxID=930120 RepID=A0ABV8H134_9BACI
MMGFFDVVGKIASAVIEESSKKQAELQRKANRQVQTYERKVNAAQRSDKMKDAAYAKKVNEAKAKLNQIKGNQRGKSTNSGSPRSVETGSTSLKSMANPFLYLNKPGVYILKMDGSIKKVGSAKIGVQKRMQQYYGLNQHCGLNQHINENNRDRIQMIFQHCPVNKCDELESKLFDKHGGVQAMPWAVRRPQNSDDTYRLKI